MKFKKLFVIITIALVISSCLLTKKNKLTSNLITIQSSEIYCGGAAPPDDLLNEMALIKPMINRDVEVFLKKDLDLKPIILRTNEKGEINVNKALGQSIYINIYPSIEQFKVDKVEYACYKAFILENLIQVKLSDKQHSYAISTVIKCNPCTPPIP